MNSFHRKIYNLLVNLSLGNFVLNFYFAVGGDHLQLAVPIEFDMPACTGMIFGIYVKVSDGLVIKTHNTRTARL